jgi:DNA-binding HxlR family transcriptional regulator
VNKLDINHIPDIFQSKLRIALVSCLITGAKSFRELKEVTGATDGNLSVHLTKLQKAGYIVIRKDFFNNKPRTEYELTQKGRNEFIEYVNRLQQIVNGYNPPENNK